MWQHLTIPHTGLTFILGMASATQWIQNSQVRWWSLNFSHLQLSFKTRHLHSFACAPSPTLRNAFHLCESICLFDVVKARTTAHAGVVFIMTKTVNLAFFLFFSFFLFFLLPTVALLSNILGGLKENLLREAAELYCFKCRDSAWIYTLCRYNSILSPAVINTEDFIQEH